MSRGRPPSFPVPPGIELPAPKALLTLLAKVQSISHPWSRFANSLMTEGSLCAEWRELAILRVGWRQRCPYVLSGHLPLARHIAISEDRVAAALGGTEGSSRHDLFSAVDQLVTQGRITRETRHRLEAVLNPEQLIELTVLAGQYVLVCMLCETFNLTPEPGVETDSHQGPTLRPGTEISLRRSCGLATFEDV